MSHEIIERTRKAIEAFLGGQPPRQVPTPAEQLLANASLAAALVDGRDRFPVSLDLDWKTQSSLGTELLSAVQGAVLRGNGRTLAIMPAMVAGELVLKVADLTGSTFTSSDRKVASDCGEFELELALDYTVQGDGTLARAVRPVQRTFFASGATMRRAMARAQSIERGWAGSRPQLMVQRTISFLGVPTPIVLSETYAYQIPLVGEIVEEGVVRTYESAWHGEETSADERCHWRGGMVSGIVTRYRRVVRFPNGRVEGMSKEVHQYISERITLGEPEAIATYVAPLRVAGALPSSRDFDRRAKEDQARAEQEAHAKFVREREAFEAQCREEQAQRMAASQEAATAQRQADEQAELLAISELEPERQARVLAFTGKSRTRALREEQAEQAQAQALKDARGSFKANLGSRTGALDLSLFGLD